MVDGFAAGADAVLAASIFHYGSTPSPRSRRARRRGHPGPAMTDDAAAGAHARADAATAGAASGAADRREVWRARRHRLRRLAGAIRSSIRRARARAGRRPPRPWAIAPPSRTRRARPRRRGSTGGVRAGHPGGSRPAAAPPLEGTALPARAVRADRDTRSRSTWSRRGGARAPSAAELESERARCAVLRRAAVAARRARGRGRARGAAPAAARRRSDDLRSIRPRREQRGTRGALVGRARHGGPPIVRRVGRPRRR